MRVGFILVLLVSMDQICSSGGVMSWEMFSWHALGSLVPTKLHCSCWYLSASTWPLVLRSDNSNSLYLKTRSNVPLPLQNVLWWIAGRSCEPLLCRNADSLVAIGPLHSGPSPGSVRLCIPTYSSGRFIPVCWKIIFRDGVDWYRAWGQTCFCAWRSHAQRNP